MTLKEFVKMIKEAVIEKGNAHSSVAQNSGYVTCRLYLTPDGNVSHEQTAIQIVLLLK